MGKLEVDLKLWTRGLGAWQGRGNRGRIAEPSVSGADQALAPLLLAHGALSP